LKWSAFAPFDKLRTGFDRLRVNGAAVEIVEYCSVRAELVEA
jgi:hypothetical protein